MEALFRTPFDRTLTFLRLVLAVVIFPHGAQKVLGWFGGGGFDATLNGFTQMGIPAFFGFLAIVAEFAGSLGLALGFLTRIAAFGIGVTMAVAVFMVHLPNGFFMNWSGTATGEGFEFHILVLGIVLTVMIKGAGAYSVDRAIWRTRGSELPRGSHRPVFHGT